MNGLSRSAFPWFVLLLALGETLAWWSLPYQLGPTADETTRNPTKHRGWPEYLDVEDDERPLVVLISNSQGVGGEVADREKIYAAFLGEHLSDKGFRFENWATGGFRTTEIELLTIKAAQRGVDHLLVVLAVNNFDPPELLNLDYPFSDITLLAGEPGLWPYLGDTLFMENAKFEDLAVRFITWTRNLARSRMAVTDLVAAHTPLKWHPLVIGHEVRPGMRLDDLKDPGISAYYPAVDLTVEELAIRRAARKTMVRDYNRDQVARRFETFRQFYPLLNSRLEKSGTKLTWVWNPVALESTNKNGRSVRNRFYEQASSIIERSGARSHDMTDALESRYFLSHGHFNESGHREFARMLIPILDDEVIPGGHER